MTSFFVFAVFVEHAFYLLGERGRSELTLFFTAEGIQFDRAFVVGSWTSTLTFVFLAIVK